MHCVVFISITRVNTRLVGNRRVFGCPFDSKRRDIYRFFTAAQVVYKFIILTPHHYILFYLFCMQKFFIHMHMHRLLFISDRRDSRVEPLTFGSDTDGVYKV